MAMSDSMRPEGETDRIGGDEVPFAEEDAREYAEELTDIGQLELGDDDERLPWLEGDDEEEEYEGYNVGQLAVFVLLGLVVLGLLVSALWWFTRKQADPELVADGSVIEAPEQPYKERPDDPGGKTFEGTGDSSFAVSEGESRPAQLGTASELPRPGFETVETTSGGKAGTSGGKAGTSGGKLGTSGGKTAEMGTSGGKLGTSGGKTAFDSAASSAVGVQVGAYSTRSSAEAAWSRLSQQYSALKGLRYRVVEGQADIGTVYRLQALPGDVAAANSLCSSLKASGLSCHVKK